MIEIQLKKSLWLVIISYIIKVKHFLKFKTFVILKVLYFKCNYYYIYSEKLKKRLKKVIVINIKFSLENVIIFKIINEWTISQCIVWLESCDNKDFVIYEFYEFSSYVVSKCLTLHNFLNNYWNHIYMTSLLYEYYLYVISIHLM